MPYAINGSGSQTWDSSWVPWLEHNSFIIQSYFAYLRSGWKCVKWGFFASTHPHERMYLHCISPPQAFRNPGQLWRGYKNQKKTKPFLCCRATLTHSRASAGNFIQCMCHPPLCGSGRVFIHLVKSVGVIVSRSVQMQSLCCNSLQWEEITQASPHPGLKCTIFFKIKCNLLISLISFPFRPRILRGRNCRHPPKLSHWMHHIFGTYIAPKLR